MTEKFKMPLYNKSRKLWSPALIDLQDYDSYTTINAKSSCISTFVKWLKQKLSFQL